MISTKKLIKMAKKWQKLAMIRQRKRISFPRNDAAEAGIESSSSTPSMASVVDKGHFVVYAADQRRFMVPLAYLNNDIFRKLLEMSEEEFGLPSDGPIVLPCDAIFIEYIISLIKKGASPDLQKAWLISVASSHCSSSSVLQLHQELRITENLLVY